MSIFILYIYIDRALSRSIYSSLHTKQDGCLKRVMERRWLLLRISCLCGSIKVNLKTSVVLLRFRSTDQPGSKRLALQEPLARLSKERAEQLPKLLATLLRLASQQCQNVKAVLVALKSLNFNPSIPIG